MLRLSQKFTTVVFLLTVLCAFSTAWSEDKKTANLKPEYKQFLDEVHWIISDYERNAFLSLKNDEDRNRFIKLFWENRDPTPGTGKNEYIEEHYARFEHANKTFGRDTSMPGWRTDRGRIWILLGKPEFVLTGGSVDLVPLELWHYVGLKDYGLPGSMYMMFYRKKGYGTYRLYSPLDDSIRDLFEGREEFTSRSEEELFEYLRTQVHSEIAHASLSYLPTEGGWYGYSGKETGSLTTQVLLANVENARNYQYKKRTYVEDILHDRPDVKVYYTISPEGVQDYVFWSLAPNGHFYIDYAVEYRPDKLEMGQYDDEYYTSITLDGQIATAEKKPIEEIKSTHEIRLDKEKFESVQKLPFQLQARKPIVPGKFDMTLIAINNVSRVAQTFVKNLAIPDMTTSTTPYFTPLLPIRTVENSPNDSKKVRPFEFGDKIYTPNLPATYQNTGNMNVYHQVIFPRDFKGDGGLQLTYILKRENASELELSDPISIPSAELAGKAIDVTKQIPLSKLQWGKKTLMVELKNAGKVISQSPVLNFEVEPNASMSLWKFAISIPGYGSPYHLSTISQQYMRLHKVAEATHLLELAVKSEPESIPTKILLMRAYVKGQKFDRVLEIGTPLEVNDPRNKEILWLMGWGNYGSGKYKDAVRFFERLRIEDPSKPEVLNLLADSYLKLEEPAKSLECLQQSLALKPDQKDIQELKKKIESGIKSPAEENKKN